MTPRPIVGVIRILGRPPQDNDLCPCGSSRRARSCHLSKNGAWIAAYPEPLLIGERTGLSHDRCYARSSLDCDSKVTREHWLSAGVLRALAPLQVSGIPWLKGATKEISVPALQSKILCARHNAALSSLDATVEPFIRALREDEKALERVGSFNSKSGDDQHTLTLISGPLWELWMLKLLLGGMASGSLGADGEKIDTWCIDVNVPNLIEVLFYGGSLPGGAGMSIRGFQPDPFGSPDSVAIIPLSSQERAGLVGVAIEMGIVEIAFSVVPVSAVLRRRVGRIQLRRENPNVAKTLAFAWSTPNEEEIRITKAVI